MTATLTRDADLSTIVDGITLLKDDTLDVLDLRAGSLVVDHSYQHPLNARRAKTISDEWSFILAMYIFVNVRDDGTLAVVDGQHRLEAFKMRFGDDAMIRCHVVYEKSLAEEAQLFRDLNGPKRKKPTQLFVFRARLVTGETDALAINATVERAGLVIDYFGGGSSSAGNKIRAIVSVERVFNRGGERALYDTLTLIRDAWNNVEHGAYSAGMIEGVFLFLSNAPTVDRARLVRVLSRVTPTVVMRRALEASSGTRNDGAPVPVAHVIADLYNKKLADTKRIPAPRLLTPTEVSKRWNVASAA